MAVVASVLIVDDRRAYAEALAMRLGLGGGLSSFENVEVAGADAAIDLLRPRLVLLDLDAAGADGPRLVEHASAEPYGAGVVALTDGDDLAAMAAVVRAGARAIVLNESSSEHLVGVLAGVAAGETHIPPAALTELLELLLSGRALSPDEALVDRLTDRERGVLELMVQGKRRAEIAAAMFVSINTVRTHTRNILGKLEVHSSVEAVSVARRAGLGT
jgi:NarL family two-component system response regulator LiaR